VQAGASQAVLPPFLGGVEAGCLTLWDSPAACRAAGCCRGGALRAASCSRGEARNSAVCRGAGGLHRPRRSRLRHVAGGAPCLRRTSPQCLYGVGRGSAQRGPYTAGGAAAPYYTTPCGYAAVFSPPLLTAGSKKPLGVEMENVHLRQRQRGDRRRLYVGRRSRRPRRRQKNGSRRFNRVVRRQARHCD